MGEDMQQTTWGDYTQTSVVALQHTSCLLNPVSCTNTPEADILLIGSLMWVIKEISDAVWVWSVNSWWHK